MIDVHAWRYESRRAASTSHTEHAREPRTEGAGRPLPPAVYITLSVSGRRRGAASAATRVKFLYLNIKHPPVGKMKYDIHYDNTHMQHTSICSDSQSCNVRLPPHGQLDECKYPNCILAYSIYTNSLKEKRLIMRNIKCKVGNTVSF